jgi:hypothetical protein
MDSVSFPHLVNLAYMSGMWKLATDIALWSSTSTRPSLRRGPQGERQSPPYRGLAQFITSTSTAGDRSGTRRPGSIAPYRSHGLQTGTRLPHRAVIASYACGIPVVHRYSIRCAGIVVPWMPSLGHQTGDGWLRAPATRRSACGMRKLPGHRLCSRAIEIRSLACRSLPTTAYWPLDQATTRFGFGGVTRGRLLS